MELLTQLDLPGTNGFFSTFFSLPSSYWQGFLSSSLDSSKLLAFAAFTFFLAPLPIKARLIGHLMTGETCCNHSWCRPIPNGPCFHAQCCSRASPS